MKAEGTAMRGLYQRNKSILAIAVTIVVFLALLVVVMEKQRFLEDIHSGQIVKATFAADYKLVSSKSLAPASKVKIAGSPVGTVQSVSDTKQGDVLVTMKVKGGTLSHLGTTPSATIRPATALGGSYFVELEPGGIRDVSDTSASIPLSRTHVPVELDTVLQALPTPTRQDLRQTLGELNSSMNNGAATNLGQVLHQAPATLAPTGQLLTAVQGNYPSSDLANLVTYADQTATTLTAQNGQIGNVVDLLNQASATLAAEAQPIKSTLANLPATLDATRQGLQSLHTTLNVLESTASAANPSIQRLEPLVSALNPTLVQLDPLLNQLKPVLEQAQPLVNELVPTTQSLSTILSEIKGPVLKDVNGPIIDTINSDWKGVGPKYAGDGNTGHPLYQDLAFLLSNLDDSNKFDQANGYVDNLSVTEGPVDLSGLPAPIVSIIQQYFPGDGG